MVHEKTDLIYADPHGGKTPKSPSRRAALALAGAGAAGLMLLAVGILGITVQGKGERYQAALSLLADRQYADAAAKLEALDGFRDSEDLRAALEAQGAAYAYALTLVEEGRYEEALTAFRSRGDYADSPRWAAWGVTYRRCTDELTRLTTARQSDAQAWLDLAESLEGLGNVEDAPALAQECRRMAEVQ